MSDPAPEAAQADLDETRSQPVADETGRSRRARRGVLVGWLVLLIVAAAIGLAIAQVRRTGTEPGALARAYGFRIGDFTAQVDEPKRPAPPIEGEGLDGERLALADYRGKVVVLNLWASWCGPCRLEEPQLERLWRQYKDKGVQFLGMNLRDQRAAARAFRDEFNVTYPSFYDPSTALVVHLGVAVLPTTFVIGADGQILLRFTGRVDAGLLQPALESILAKGGA